VTTTSATVKATKMRLKVSQLGGGLPRLRRIIPFPPFTFFFLYFSFEVDIGDTHIRHGLRS